MRTRTLTAGVLALALAVTLPASGKPKDPVVVPDESGCRDVVGGAARYQQLLATFSQAEFAPGTAALGMYQAAEVTVRDKGVATAELVLAAVSCPDVDYVLEAYDVNTSALLARNSERGDGVSGTEANALVLEVVVPGYSSSTVALRAFTVTGSVVHDFAPDAELPAEQAQAGPNGLPGGGAVSSFK